MRHAADDRLELPVRGVPARGRSGTRCPDRRVVADAVATLSDGGEPPRRLRIYAAGAAAAAEAEDRSLVARRGRRLGQGLVEGDGGARDGAGEADQPAARVLGDVAALARSL